MMMMMIYMKIDDIALKERAKRNFIVHSPDAQLL